MEDFMRTLLLRTSAWLFAVLVMAGCSSVQVSQDYDPRAAMLSAGTWQWRVPVQPVTGDVRVDNPLLDKRIRRAVENHLSGRKFSQVAERPDFYLSYHLTIDQKIVNDTVYSTAGVGGYYHPWYGGVGTETRVWQYDESRLTIDILSALTGELMWRGVGTFRLRTYQTPEKAAEAMRSIVDKILSQFPPGGQS
jgi:hypothetical protein